MSTDQTKQKLQKEIAFLKKEISELKKNTNNNHEKYRAIFEQSSDSMLLVDTDTGFFLDFNDKAHKNLGYTREEFKQLKIKDVESVKSDIDHKKRLDRILKNGPNSAQIKVRQKNGEKNDVLARAKPVIIKNKKYILVTWTDITKQIKSQVLLKQKEKELEDTITAMKVLLKQRKNEKFRIEKELLTEMKHTITPYLEKLKNVCSDTKHLKYLGIIDLNLKEINSEFTATLSRNFPDLTPSEIQVANLIKLSKNSKAISELLNLSTSTVNFHRKNIRKKLCLHHTPKSLKRYLLSIQ